MYEYVKTLHSLRAEVAGVRKGNDANVSGLLRVCFYATCVETKDCSLSTLLVADVISQSEYFSEMYTDPHVTLGDIVFKHGVDPTRIESVVSELGIDLTEVLLDNCCPCIPLQLRSGKN